jgi:CRP-like cAMP-binding protein
VIVGAIETAADTGQIASGIPHFRSPTVVAAGLETARKADLDPGAFYRRGWSLGGGVGFGLRFCHGFVEIKGEFASVGRDLRVDQLGRHRIEEWQGGTTGQEQAKNGGKWVFHEASISPTPLPGGLLQNLHWFILVPMDSNPLLQKYGRIFEPGELIFEENDDGEHMFIIQEGQVTISRTINGQDTPVALLEKGEFFGEMAIVNRIRRTASARAHARTQLLAFDRAGLEQLVEKNPKIALNIIDRLCRRLGSANAQIRQMAQQTSRHSLWVALQVLAQKEEGMGTLHQIQEELGMTLQYPQAELETLVRNLVDRGALAFDGDRLLVRDRQLFHDLVEAL